MKKIILFLITVIYLSCFFFGCKDDYLTKTLDTLYFNTSTTVVLNKKQTTAVSKEQAIIDIENILSSIENAVSITKNTSDIYKFNALKKGESIVVNDITKELLILSIEYYTLTNGKFNILAYPITDLWGLSSEKYGKINFQIPENLSNYGKLLSKDNFTLNENVLTKNNYDEVKIDLGGIAKGYALNQIVDYLKNNGFTDGYISIGKSSIYLGEYNEKTWNLSITNPTKIDEYFLTLGIKNEHISTSGNYERYYELDGVKYCHIIDTETLSPVQNGILSVTLTGNDACLIDALTTALTTMGLENAIEFYKQNLENFGVFITFQSKDELMLYTNYEREKLSFLSEKFIFKKI